MMDERTWNQRPKSNETEEDLIRMNRYYLEQKSSNEELLPSAHWNNVKFLEGEQEPPRKMEENKVEYKESLAAHETRQTSAVNDILNREINTNILGNLSDEEEVTHTNNQIRNCIMRDVVEMDSVLDFGQDRIEPPPPNKSESLYRKRMRNVQSSKMSRKTSSLVDDELEVNDRQNQININRIDDVPSLINRMFESTHELAHNIENMGSPPSIVEDIMKTAHEESWLNFDNVEMDKLQWIQDIPIEKYSLNPNEQYEARFNWDGELLPFMFDVEYTSPQNQNTDRRDLYMHGEDPHRPGYTIQELFRLSRSKIFQQRQLALKAITGIIDIYQKGFYDNIVDLPISNIFFLFRYALDESIESIIEIAAKGLALLFYNESDEAFHDLAHENYGDHVPPITYTETESVSSVETFRNSRKKLKAKVPVRGTVFKSTLDKEENFASMTDFELAETSLMECLLRTNIISRIYYILEELRPGNTTPISCFKLLIAIAHTNDKIASTLIDEQRLFRSLIELFLPMVMNIDTCLTKVENAYKYPQFLVLKLLRVLLSTKRYKFWDFLNRCKILDIMEGYLRSSTNLSVPMIKVHIESLRVLKCLYILPANYKSLDIFRPSLEYYLDWHYKHLIFENSNYVLLKQHAAALFSVINVYFRSKKFVFEKLVGLVIDCASKLFNAAAIHGIRDIISNILLSAALESLLVCLSRGNEKTFEKFFPIFSKFQQSSHFEEFVRNSIKCSSIYNCDKKPRNIYPSMTHLGSVIQTKSGPGFVLDLKSPYVLLNCILRMKRRLHELGMVKCGLLGNVTNFPKTVTSTLIKYLCSYKQNESNKINYSLSTNHFAQCEINFMISLLQCEEITSHLTGAQMYHIIFSSLPLLTIDKFMKNEKFYIEAIFTSRYINIDEFVQKKCKKIYYIDKITFSLRLSPFREKMSIRDLNTVFSIDWAMKPLKDMYREYIKGNFTEDSSPVLDREKILCVCKFMESINENCPTLVLYSPTEKLMYYMMTYLSKYTVFLEEDVDAFLDKQITKFFAECKNIDFDFNTVIDGISFEMLYLAFIEQFEACSFCTPVFSALVMVPLAQKYDVKWRLRVWSEYVVAMRYIRCDKKMLLGGIDAYKTPVETDRLLLKGYSSAKAQNILLPDSIAYELVHHHLQI